jgi:hypothetical protein
MTAKQYIGLVALICLLGSGFAANQWLKFAKALHAYQRQLTDEKQQLADQKQKAAEEEQIRKDQLTQTEIDALVKYYKPPIDKAWDQFQQDVEHISYTFPSTDVQGWCNNMTDAIQKKDFTLFNYLIGHTPPYSSVRYLLHFPDLHMPGLTPADIVDLSKFVKPEM